MTHQQNFGMILSLKRNEIRHRAAVPAPAGIQVGLTGAPNRSFVLRAQGRISRKPLYSTLIGIVLGLSLVLPGPIFGQTQYLNRMISNHASCAKADDGSGDAVCAVMDATNVLYGIRFNPQTGYDSGLQLLTETLVGRNWTGSPSCASADDGQGSAVCAVTRTDGAVYGIQFNPKAKTKTAYMGLGIAPGTDYAHSPGSPICVQATGVPGEVVCLVSGGGVLSGIGFTPSTGTKTDYKFSTILGPTNWASCAPASDGSGDSVCGFNGGVSGFLGFRFNPQTNYQTPIVPVGSTSNWFDRPSCAPAGLGDLVCVAYQDDGTLYGFRFNPQTGYGLGDKTNVQPLLSPGLAMVPDAHSCVQASDGSGNTNCVVKLGDGTLTGIKFNPQTKFHALFVTGVGANGQKWADSPSCIDTGNGTDNLVCAGKGTDGVLYGIRFTP